MGQSMGMLDFFVLEAGEYLERLDALAQTPAGPFPSAEEFVRIARAFRGSALMASHQPMARAAQGLESVVRSARDGRVAWDERVRAEVVRAVDDCKTLLRRIRTPSADDAAKAEAMGTDLERLAGRTPGPTRGSGTGLDAGGRAFVAREAAAIASTLDHLARALTADPAGREALGSVTPAMSALRGVAVLNDLPPLADILVGVEGATKEVLATSGAVGPAVPRLFDAAAKALARGAREVVDLGRPAPDSEEAGAFASLLLAAFASTGNILPIEHLFYDDAGPHIVREGTAPAGLTRLEIVSQGEFLATTVGELGRTMSPVLRALRLFGMAASLRPLAGAGGSPLSGGLGRLADSGRSAIDRGAAAASLSSFVAIMAEAAAALSSAETGDEAALAGQLDAASAKLQALASGQAEPVAAPPSEPVRTTRVIAATPARPSREAVASARAAAPHGEADLAESYVAFERLTAERGLPGGALDELFTAPTAPLAPEEEGVVPIEALAPDRAEEDVISIETLAPAEPEIVPIETLLYRGPSALKRARELRAELEAMAVGGPSPRFRELLREVFDLVELGTAAD